MGSEFLSVELNEAASDSNAKFQYRSVLYHVLRFFPHTVTNCDGSAISLVQTEMTLE